MTGRQTQQQLLAQGEIVARAVRSVPAAIRASNFPAGIYIAMATMFTGFVAVLGLAFRGGHMAVVVRRHIRFHRCLLCGAGNVSAVAAREKHRALSWSEFGDRGIMTATGHSSAREATILVLLLPFLILCFGIAVVAIASLV